MFQMRLLMQTIDLEVNGLEVDRHCPVLPLPKSCSSRRPGRCRINYLP